MTKPIVNRRLWTADERKLLVEIFADNYTASICQIMNRSYSSVSAQACLMGLKKGDDFKKLELAKQAAKLKMVGVKGRYQKGHIPVNAGKKMPAKTYDRCKATMFKKGQKPHNAYNNWEEVLRRHKTGKQYWLIKLPTERKLKPKHIWLWENKYGKVPKGDNVVFKDGNTLNCCIENLECISRAMLMQRNSINRFPIELKSTIRIVNQLKRTINAKEQN
jgi:hypothetical protein